MSSDTKFMRKFRVINVCSNLEHQGSTIWELIKPAWCKHKCFISITLKLKFNITIKDTHRENTPSNKTQAPAKSINMGIWVIGTLNQLFMRGSSTQIKFSKI